MDARKSPGLAPEAGQELAWVSAARLGDPAALAALLRLWRRALWRLAFALTRDRVRAERLLRDLARRAYRERHALPAEKSALPTFVRLACELAGATAGSTAAGASARRPSGEPWDNANGAHHPYFERRLLTVFAQLPMADQAMLALRLFERMNVNDVALACGSDPARTLQRLSELREKMAHALQRTRAAA